MPDLDTILLLIIAVSLAPNLVLPVLQFLPLPSKLIDLIKRSAKTDEAPQWAVELQTHYNHDTTKILGEIRDGVRDMNTKLDTIEPCKK